MTARTFEIQGDKVDVDARRKGDRLTLEENGETRAWSAIRVGTAEFVVRDDADSGRNHSVHAIRDDSTWWVHVDGRTYRFKAVVERGGSGGGGGSLAAPIPATVVEVLVANGERVETDQVLLVLSAMKMQLEIRAPHGGNVADLELQADDPVDGGQQLLTIVPVEEEPAAEEEAS